jgi:hypothetical protein
MSSVEALVNDLELSISDQAILDSMDICAADGDAATIAGWTVPPIVSVFAKWALAQAMRYGCEYREQILTAVRQFVAAKIPNPMLQAMIMSAVETLVLQQCG